MKRPYFLFTAVSVIALGFCIQLAPASTTAVLLPKSDGNYQQFATSTGSSSHWALVDETLCNGTTDYNYTVTTSKRDSYGISVTSIGDGAIVTQVAIVPCLSRHKITTSTPVGSATTSLFYRWNLVDSADFATASTASSITPTQRATSTVSGLSLFKTSTSIYEIGMVYVTGTKGVRLSRIATVLTYTLTAPAAPTALAVNNVSATRNDLTWTDNSDNELRFNIYRSRNNAAYTQIATTASWNTTSTASYNDTSVTAGNTYAYEVVAYNSAGTATSSVVYSTKTVSGNLTSSTSWQPYYVYAVNGLLTVNSGARLTIDAGTIVKFQDATSKPCGRTIRPHCAPLSGGGVCIAHHHFVASRS